MGKIGIIQLDGKVPNLALMKIAGFHETKGDTVDHPDLGLAVFENGL